MSTHQMLEDRIVELVFCPWQDLPRELKKLGLKAQLNEDGESISIDNGHQKHGLTDIDPTTKAVILAAAITGSFRIGFYFPGLLDKVKKRWSKNTRSFVENR